jgi:hypothetical protein
MTKRKSSVLENSSSKENGQTRENQYNHNYNTRHQNKKRCRYDQYHFRQNLLKRFPTCVISGHSFYRSDACHIKPYSQCNNDEKYDINNGLIIDSGLHKLFDRYLLSINPRNSIIEIKSKIVDFDPDLLNYLGKKIQDLPTQTLKYLEFHYSNYERK